jgi:hypothetical protein
VTVTSQTHFLSLVSLELADVSTLRNELLSVVDRASEGSWNEGET